MYNPGFSVGFYHPIVNYFKVRSIIFQVASGVDATSQLYKRHSRDYFFMSIQLLLIKNFPIDLEEIHSSVTFQSWRNCRYIEKVDLDMW